MTARGRSTRARTGVWFRQRDAFEERSVGFRVQGLGLRVLGLMFSIQGLGFSRYKIGGTG